MASTPLVTGDVPPVYGAIRDVEGFVHSWCDSMSASDQRAIIESFKTVEALNRYLHDYLFGRTQDRDDQPRPANVFEVMDELLAFPCRTDMDPSNPETIKWAKFFVPFRTGGTYVRRERLGWEGVLKLRQAGVPLEYAQALDTPTWDTQMPVHRIIRLYRDGVPAEYARGILYGAEA